MRKPLALAFIVTMAAVFAYFTKPDDEKCREEARQKFKEKLDQTRQGLPAGINKTVWLQALENSFEESLQVEDKLLYKTIYQSGDAAKTRIGWGAFGFVQIELP